jgi:glycosyltransferase involved in cell wall biosynthesis
VPIVSVVVPTRDRSALLLQTLASVRAQRGVDLEIIVVDDGSIDRTRDRVSALADPRIRLIGAERSSGVSTARNEGVSATRGEWIAFLDDDDLWAPHKLANQLAAADAIGRDWVCSGSVTVTDALRVVAGVPPRSPEVIAAALPFRNSIPAGASNVLVRREMLERAGPFEPRLRHMADWDLWIRLGALGLPAVVHEPDVAYRLHADNASTDAEAIDGELRLIADRHASRRTGVAIDRAFVLRWAAWNLLRTRRRSAAALLYGRAIMTGDWSSILRLVLTLADPHAAERALRRGLDRGWAARAEAWLREYGA